MPSSVRKISQMKRSSFKRAMDAQSASDNKVSIARPSKRRSRVNISHKRKNQHSVKSSTRSVTRASRTMSRSKNTGNMGDMHSFNVWENLQNKSNYKIIRREAWPEWNLVLYKSVDGDDCPNCKGLEDFFRLKYKHHLDKLKFRYVSAEHNGKNEKHHRLINVSTKKEWSLGFDDWPRKSEREEEKNTLNENASVEMEVDGFLEEAKDLQEFSKQVRKAKLKLGRLFSQGKPFQMLVHQKDFVNRTQNVRWNSPGMPIHQYWKMGSGKTCGSIMAVCGNNFVPSKVIIECDKSVLSHWSETIEKTIQAQGRTTFHIIGPEELKKQILDDPRFLDNSVLVLDEAHRYRCLSPVMMQKLKVFANAPRVLLLTGTPVVNHISEFVVYLMMMRVLDLPIDTISQSELLDLIPKCQSQLLSVVKGLRNRVHFFDPHEDEDTLFKNYPQFQRKDVIVPMSFPQTLEYLLAEKQKVLIGDVWFRSSKRNSYNCQVRGISNCMLDLNTQEPLLSPKSLAVVQNIINVNLEHGRPVPQVVYSEFIARGIDLVERQLKNMCPDLRVFRLRQDMLPDEREKMCKEFSKGGCDVLLMSRVGGVGINLHNAYALHRLEVSQTQQQQNQIDMRVIRYRKEGEESQDHTVQIFGYISCFPTEVPSNSEETDLKKYFTKIAGMSVDDIKFDLSQELLQLTKNKETFDQQHQRSNPIRYNRLLVYLSILKEASSNNPGPFKAHQGVWISDGFSPILQSMPLDSDFAAQERFRLSIDEEYTDTSSSGPKPTKPSKPAKRTRLKRISDSEEYEEDHSDDDFDDEDDLCW